MGESACSTALPLLASPVLREMLGTARAHRLVTRPRPSGSTVDLGGEIELGEGARYHLAQLIW